MIGIDADILLHLGPGDEPAQSERIDSPQAAHGAMPGSLPVTDVVLVEAVGMLRSAFDQDMRA
jgi:hypothetical protein